MMSIEWCLAFKKPVLWLLSALHQELIIGQFIINWDAAQSIEKPSLWENLPQQVNWCYVSPAPKRQLLDWVSSPAILDMNQSLELIGLILRRSSAQNLIKWWLAMMLVWRISHGSRWWFRLWGKWGLSLYLLRYFHTHSCLVKILGRNILWQLYLSSYTAMLLIHTALFIHMPVHRVWLFAYVPSTWHFSAWHPKNIHIMWFLSERPQLPQYMQDRCNLECCLNCLEPQSLLYITLYARNSMAAIHLAWKNNIWHNINSFVSFSADDRSPSQRVENVEPADTLHSQSGPSSRQLWLDGRDFRFFCCKRVVKSTCYQTYPQTLVMASFWTFITAQSWSRGIWNLNHELETVLKMVLKYAGVKSNFPWLLQALTEALTWVWLRWWCCIKFILVKLCALLHLYTRILRGKSRSERLQSAVNQSLSNSVPCSICVQ